MGEDEQDLVAKIARIWDDLFVEAREVDESLAEVKKSFTDVSHKKLKKNN